VVARHTVANCYQKISSAHLVPDPAPAVPVLRVLGAAPNKRKMAAGAHRRPACEFATASGLQCLPGYEDLKKRTFGRAFLFRTVVLQTDVCYNVDMEKEQ